MPADGGDAVDLGDGANFSVENLLREQISSKAGVIVDITQSNVPNTRLSDQGDSHNSARRDFDKFFHWFCVK